MGYLKQTFKGVSWMGALRVVLRGLTFLRIAVLARLLTPEQFGLFGVASLVLAFLEIVTETGINVFFIQGEGKLKDYLDTAWIISIFRGILISSILVMAAPFISKFFKSPGSLELVYLIAAIPFIRGFINPSIVKFQKKLEFNKEFSLRTGIFLIDSIATITVAYLYKTASSFVIGMTAGVLLEVFISQLFIKPRPRFSFNSTKLKKIIKRGKWVTTSNILSYLFTCIDDMVVGRILGTASLGIYQMAYKMSELPITEIANVFYQVTFPVFVKIQDDRARLKKAFLKTLAISSSLAIVVGLILIFFTKDVVLLILGENWISSVKVLKILTIAGVLRAVLGESPAIFLAVKKQEYVTFVTFIAVLVIAFTIYPLVNRFGIEGAGISALAGSLLSAPFIIYYLNKIFNSKNDRKS